MEVEDSIGARAQGRIKFWSGTQKRQLGGMASLEGQRGRTTCFEKSE